MLGWTTLQVVVRAGDAPRRQDLGDLNNSGIASLDPLCKMCVAIHKTVEVTSTRFLKEYRRNNYVTPTSYLELIGLFCETLKAQRKIVDGKIQRYIGGVEKLKETSATVQTLSEEIEKFRLVGPVLLRGH